MDLYRSEDRTSREDLAAALILKMAECGFKLEPPDSVTREAVYARDVEGTEGRICVRVFTSVEQGRRGPVTRRAGSDAIRVCAVYKGRDGRSRGIAKAEHRVNRVGEISDIVMRTYERMREVYKAARCSEKCERCGAPKFRAKSGNMVCADLCWLSPEEMSRPWAKPRRTAAYYKPSLRKTEPMYRPTYDEVPDMVWPGET